MTPRAPRRGTLLLHPRCPTSGTQWDSDIYKNNKQIQLCWEKRCPTSGTQWDSDIYKNNAQTQLCREERCPTSGTHWDSDLYNNNTQTQLCWEKRCCYCETHVSFCVRTIYTVGTFVYGQYRVGPFCIRTI